MPNAFLLANSKAFLLSGTKAFLLATVSGGGGTTPPPIPDDFDPSTLSRNASFPFPVSLKNTSATAAPQGEMIRFGVVFGWGDVPVGSRITATYQGAPLAVQQDGEHWNKVLSNGTRQNHSLASAIVSIPLPAALAAGAFLPADVLIGCEVGTPLRTPSQTTTTLLAALPDLKMVYTGGTLGSATYEVSLTDIINNGSARPWPANPLRCYQIVAAGDNRLTVEAFGYLKNTSGGNYHAWAFGVFRLTIWKNGNVDLEYAEPLRNGTFAAAAKSDGDFIGSDPTRCPMVAAKVELKNGSSTLIANMAGSPVTVPSGGVSQNGIAVLAPYNGQAWQFSGSLPSGLSPSTTYFGIHNNTPCLMSTRRLDPENGDTAQYVATIGSASSSFTATPLAFCHQFTSYICADTKGRPIRLVGGARPNIEPFHDLRYLTQRAAFAPPLDPALLMDGTRTGSDGSTFAFNSGTLYCGRWNINGGGADPNDNRIGYLNNPMTAALYKSAPAVEMMRVIQNAALMSHHNALFDDARAGPSRPMAFNNGGEDDGAAYAELGPLQPDWAAELGNMPVQPVLTYYGGEGEVVGGGKLRWYDTSHNPSDWMVAWLKTGCEIWSEHGMYQAFRSGHFWMHKRPLAGAGREWYETVGRKSLYGINQMATGQSRANAWAFRMLDSAHYICPDWHPGRPLLDKMHEDNCTALDWQTQVKTFPGVSAINPGVYDPFANYTPGAMPESMRNLGLLLNMAYEDKPGKESLWMNAFTMAVMANSARRGNAAGYRAMLHKMRLFDLLNSQLGGCAWWANQNDLWWSADKSGNYAGPYRAGLNVFRPDDGVWLETGTCPASNNLTSGNPVAVQGGTHMQSMSEVYGTGTGSVSCNSYVAIVRWAVFAALATGQTRYQTMFDDILARIAVLNPGGVINHTPTYASEKWNAPAFIAPASVGN